jgi:methionine-rich copper-binding protein CopC
MCDRFSSVRRHPGRFAFVALFVTLLVIAGGSRVAPVRAHAEFDHSNPTPNATVPSAPSIVEAWFTEDLDSNGTVLSVFGPDGSQVDKGDSAVDLFDPLRRHATVSLKDGLGPGTYIVKWTSVSSIDGDTANGSFTFTVGGSGTPCTSGTPGATPSPATPALATPGTGTPTAVTCDPITVDAGFGTPAAAGGMTVTLTVDKTSAGPRALTATFADSSGAPITDATVQFSAQSLDMDMGIAQASATMTSPGQYAGTVNMGMGGNWQVDVGVVRPGQPEVVIRYTVALTGPG